MTTNDMLEFDTPFQAETSMSFGSWEGFWAEVDVFCEESDWDAGRVDMELFSWLGATGEGEAVSVVDAAVTEDDSCSDELIKAR